MRIAIALPICFALVGCSPSGTPPAPSDAGLSDGDAGPPGASCPDRAPPPDGARCQVTGGSAALLITATILLPDGPLHGGQVVVDGQGKIACAGCDCSAQAAAAGATEVYCPSAVLSPGLINAHDHITFQSAPGFDSGERYEQRNDWRKGLRGHTKLSSGGTASTNLIRWAELRMVMGGATSTVGSGGEAGLLRNLDKADPLQEGLAHKPVDYDTFPLGDSNGTQLSSGCGYPSPTGAGAIAADSAYFPHIAEGIDATARNEFVCVSMPGPYDLAQPQSAFIHSVGLEAADYAAMAKDGVALVWSPRSNMRLYGDTARVTEAARFGALIALGTDWLQSGSMNMLRELRCADGLNRNYFGGYFEDRDLWRMATANAASAAAMDDAIGAIKTGLVADLALFDGSQHADYRAVIEAAPADVILVMRGGRVLHGDRTIVEAIPGLAGACDVIDVCGSAKEVCLQHEIGMTLPALQAATPGAYPLFFCDQPTNEPTCVPKRPKSVSGSTVYDGTPSATDSDGDGIPDAMDDCPSVFNPIRPVDQGAQGDADGDGRGDACDPCPLTAGDSC